MDRLGDFVMALGAIHRIVEREGSENCLLIIAPFAREIARREFPHVEQVLVTPWHANFGAMRAHIRELGEHEWFRRGVTHLICLRHSRFCQEEVVINSIPASETWGAANSELGRESGQWLASMPLTHRSQVFPQEPLEPREFARHRAVVSNYLGIELSAAELLPDVKSTSGTTERFVAVSPYGSAAIRDFPRSLLIAAGEFIGRNWKLPLRLLVPPGDPARFQELRELLSGAGLKDVSLYTCLTLDALIDAVSASVMTLSVETATAHLAIALNKPTVAILGGGHHGWFAPWQRTSRQIWLSHSVPCYHCNWNCSLPKPICMTEISPDSVCDATSRAMAGNI